MLHIHSVTNLDEFIVSPNDPPGFLTQIAELWASAESRPEWAFVAVRDGQPVARVGFRVADTLPDPTHLGSLPPQEMFVYGLAGWGEQPVEDAAELLAGALQLAALDLPANLDLRTNPAVHNDVEFRLQVAARTGMELFQEKQGVLWQGESLTGSERLRFRNRVEVGDEGLVRLVASVGEGTLDRNDRYYFNHMAPEAWATVYVSFFEPAETTLVGYQADEPVGFVAVNPFDEEETATISFIGVAPAHRGHGYVDDLLIAGTRAAKEAGYRKILSDVDTENGPMLAAMERCGHRSASTPWHIWHHRTPVERLVRHSRGWRRA